MSEITWIPGGVIGFKKEYQKAGGDEELVAGAILAFRKGGDEALFARSDDDQDDDGNYRNLKPLEWIEVDQFCASPVAIATEDDFVDDSPEPSPGPRPVADEPEPEESAPRKSRIRRREEA